MRRGLLAFLAAFVLAFASGLAAPAAADSQIVVTPPLNSQGWSTADTRPGGTVSFVSDPTAPGSPHNGALQLTTDATPTAKAQYLHAASTLLADVTELSYHTKQLSAAFPGGDPSYQLIMCLNGVTGTGACSPSGAPLATSSFTTLVFEPYQNGLVLNNIWQLWDVDQGQFWSTRTVICTGGALVGQEVTAGGGGAPFYTLAMIKTMCPNAVVIGFGVNIGSNNPSYVVRTDLFNFNGTTYNFEPLLTRPGCRDSQGQGTFEDRGKHKGNMSFTHTCKNGDNNPDGDSFASTDRGDGQDFHSTSVASVVIDDSANTITMTGVGSSTGGLPTTFVLVAIPTTATTPGWVSMTFGDGYAIAGDLLTGEVFLAD
jgi:hypothetical protein